LALFCVNPLIQKIDEVTNIVGKILQVYCSGNKLRPYDLAVIPDLMLGTYAANNLAANFELRGKKNDNAETRYWIKLGLEGMKLMERVRSY